MLYIIIFILWIYVYIYIKVIYIYVNILRRNNYRYLLFFGHSLVVLYNYLKTVIFLVSQCLF